MAVSISQVSFEHHYPVALGVGETTPRISWRFAGDAADWTQQAYSIEVSRGPGVAQNKAAETFDFNSSSSVLVDWPTVALTSTESASVRVKAYGAPGQPDTDWSDAVTVETGLLTQDDWAGALMIAADNVTDVTLPKRPVLFRKEFEVESGEEIASARLYITSYGVYEAVINGQRVGNAVLAPGWQPYGFRLVYDTYDVTDLLKLDGANAIGVQVGEGWYAGRLAWETQRNIYGDTLGAMALLAITRADGSQQLVPTDGSWSAGVGPIMTSEIYDGEKYDSRLEQPGWASPGFSAGEGWIAVKELEAPFDRLTAPDGPPIAPIEEVELVQVLTSPSGKTILDFGQNLVGWLRLSVKGPAGTAVTLVHAEVTVDGEIATTPLRTATQTDILTLSGGDDVWEPRFTYHGFRYVQVSNWPTDTTPLDANAVKAVVISSAMQETGSFECSNQLLNKLHQNVRWSMKGNFMSIPTDCPQRDERLGWTGDAHAFAPTANFLYDTSGFWRGWLKGLIMEQLSNSGKPGNVSPNVLSASESGTAIWGDVVVGNPWLAYMSYGDLAMLEEEYEGAKAWLDQGIARNDVGLWDRSAFQFGDWLDPLAPADDPGAASTNPTFVADGYLVYVTDLVAKIATDLGHEEDAAYYLDWAATLREEYVKAWVNADGTVYNETQTGLALPLYFDLFPTQEQSLAAANRLETIIADNEYLVGTGFAGTHLLGLTMTKINLTETFYKMIEQTTVPSWLYQVEMNATTTWERWDSLLSDGSLNPGSMTSFNHYAFGSVANWMHQTIGGLAPAEPAWKVIKVAPIPGGSITSAQATYLSPYGVVSTDWNIDGGVFNLQLLVPPNSKAEVSLPGIEEVYTVGSGTHEFSVQGDSVEHVRK